MKDGLSRISREFRDRLQTHIIARKHQLRYFLHNVGPLTFFFSFWDPHLVSHPKWGAFKMSWPEPLEPRIPCPLSLDCGESSVNVKASERNADRAFNQVAHYFST